MIRHPLLFALVIATLCGCQRQTTQEDADSEIRASVAKYVEAYNSQDAKALADLWSTDGVYIDRSNGHRIQGREAIEQQFTDTFSDDHQESLAVDVKSVRLIADDVAIEEGVATVVRTGELPWRSSYEAVHVREDGTWKIESVREQDLPTPSSHYEHLRDLEWLVGEWVDEGDGDSVRLVCEWTKNRNFLTRSFAVSIQDRVELEGTQVIGYDAAEQKLRYWLFDSDGGYIEGNWVRDADEPDRWTITGSGVLAGGKRASMVNVMKKVDDDTFTWETISREIDGELLPNIDPVSVVRVKSNSHLD